MALQSVVSVKGMRNRVEWTVEELDAPHHVVLRGSGKGGTKFKMRLAVAGAGGGIAVDDEDRARGSAAVRPIGSGVARALQGDLDASLRKFAELYG